MSKVTISGDPSDEEVAAILAAVEGAWPRAAVPPQDNGATRWKWSGRWWSRPIPQRRIRPW